MMLLLVAPVNGNVDDGDADGGDDDVEGDVTWLLLPQKFAHDAGRCGCKPCTPNRCSSMYFLFSPVCLLSLCAFAKPIEHGGLHLNALNVGEVGEVESASQATTMLK